MLGENKMGQGRTGLMARRARKEEGGGVRAWRGEAVERGRERERHAWAAFLLRWAGLG